MPPVHLPHHLVIPIETLTTFWALTNLAVGFVYLLYGLRVFRVMTTITASIWGAAVGYYFSDFIDSPTVAMIFAGAAFGFAAWHWTKWMVALPFGLAAAALGWLIARDNAMAPLPRFFIALACGVAVGTPLVVFYRTMVMALTCIQGASLVVLGSATGILLLRHKPITLLQHDLQNPMHLLLGGVCMLMLAVPAFYFQGVRFVNEHPGGSGESAKPAASSSPQKKAA